MAVGARPQKSKLERSWRSYGVEVWISAGARDKSDRRSRCQKSDNIIYNKSDKSDNNINNNNNDDNDNSFFLYLHRYLSFHGTLVI